MNKKITKTVTVVTEDSNGKTTTTTTTTTTTSEKSMPKPRRRVSAQDIGRTWDRFDDDVEVCYCNQPMCPVCG